MPRSRRFAFVALGAVIATAGGQAVACVCEPPTSVQQALDEVDVVFVGRVIAVSPRIEMPGPKDKATTTFAVERVLKGEISPKYVLEEPAMSTCRGYFPVGSEHVIRLRRTNGHLGGHSCLQAVPFSVSDFERAAGEAPIY